MDKRELAETGVDFHYQIATFNQSPMLVCHCHALTDRDVRRAVRTSGACTVAEVGEQCGAATGCGGCHELVAEIVACEKRRLAVFGPSDPPAHDALRPKLEHAQLPPDLLLTG